MKKRLSRSIYAAFFALWLCGSCSKIMSPATDGEVPYPHTPGIIPLIPGSIWRYSHTAYDSTGARTLPLMRAVDREYGLLGDTVLELITEENQSKKFTLFVYEYEWDSAGSGILISYRDTNVDTTGVYIHGEYNGEHRVVFGQPVLWLKYPALPKDTWTVRQTDSTDTLPVVYEVLDTAAEFSIPAQDNTGVSPVEFISCYLYKRTKADITSYHYYTRRYGSVGFLEYRGHTLLRSYILKKYTLPYRYF